MIFYLVPTSLIELIFQNAKEKAALTPSHCDLNHSIFVSFVIVFILDWTPCHPSPSPPLPSSLFQLDPRPAAAASCDPCLATNPTTNPSSPHPFLPTGRQLPHPSLSFPSRPAASQPSLLALAAPAPPPPRGPSCFFSGCIMSEKGTTGLTTKKF